MLTDRQGLSGDTFSILYKLYGIKRQGNSE
jgi:hypothetical protein